MFDRNASTQRIRALVETPLSLSEEPKPPAEPRAPAVAAAKAGPGRAAPPSMPSSLRPASGNPYEPAVPPATPRAGESAGCDPYGRGASRPRGGR